MYRVVFARQAQKDKGLLAAAGLAKRAVSLIEVLQVNPYQAPPAYEKLTGELKGLYSRRINLQHRIVYEVIEEINTVRVLRMWSHYE